MSAYALIIGLPHAPDAPHVVISGPEVPYQDQREKFKREFMEPRCHETYRQVQLLDSRRGVRKRKSFITPAEDKRRRKALAAQEREFAKANAKPGTAPQTPAGDPASTAPQAPTGNETEPGDPGNDAPDGNPNPDAKA